MTTPEPEQPDQPRDLPGLAAFATLGTTIALTLGVFVAIGLWLDAELHTSPWLLLTGIVLGCVAATSATVALVRRYL